jgi:hypothetical protein
MSDQQTIGPDNLLAKVRQLVMDHYSPAYGLDENPVLMTTIQIYTELQKVYPAEYSAPMLAVWLEDWGFRMKLTGNMHFEWMLKRKLHA